MMKDLDEAKDGNNTKTQNASAPKEEPNSKMKVEETVKDEVKAAEKKPKAAPVKKEEPPTDKTPK